MRAVYGLTPTSGRTGDASGAMPEEQLVREMEEDDDTDLLEEQDAMELYQWTQQLSLEAISH